MTSLSAESFGAASSSRSAFPLSFLCSFFFSVLFDSPSPSCLAGEFNEVASRRPATWPRRPPPPPAPLKLASPEFTPDPIHLDERGSISFLFFFISSLIRRPEAWPRPDTTATTLTDADEAAIAGEFVCVFVCVCVCVCVCVGVYLSV